MMTRTSCTVWPARCDTNRISFYTASSGEEALLILKTRNVDVIVTDEQMPGMCGGDLRAWVAENCPDVRRIVLTGRPTVETAIRAINEGAVYQFFTKPCNPAHLGVAIRKALEHKDLLMENRQLLDINRRQMQELEHYRRDVEVLTNLVAHDVREPLQAVARLSKSLEGQYDDSFGLEPSALVENALEGAAQLERLANDLLERCRSEPSARSATPPSSGEKTAGSRADGLHQTAPVVLSEMNSATLGEAWAVP